LTSIITRSALVFYGHNPAPDVASVVIDHEGRHVITWDDVMRRRREEQDRRLAWKRRVDEWRACKVWVAYFDQVFYGGWHAFLEDRLDCQWLRGREGDERLMKMFPLVPDGEPDRWRAWMIAFAKKFKRRRQHRKPLGVAYLWRRRHELRRIEDGTADDG
jgi:hypothetical protein